MSKKTFVFAIVLGLLSVTSASHSISRWFRVSPGFRVGGAAIDIVSRNPSYGTATRFDFALGFNLDIQLEKHIGLDLELLYLRKGSTANPTTILLHYLAIPTMFKVWFIRKKAAFTVGFIHNFLLDVKGSLPGAKPLLKSDLVPYDFSIAFGFSYVFKEFTNGMRIMGDFRFEFGLVNISKYYSPRMYNRVYPYFAVGLNF